MAMDENGDYIPGSQLSKGPKSRYAYKHKTSFTVDYNTTQYVKNFEKINWGDRGAESDKGSVREEKKERAKEGQA